MAIRIYSGYEGEIKPKRRKFEPSLEIMTLYILR